MIENRNLPVGTRLVATYKKQAFVCTVEAGEEGKLTFVIEDGKRYTSPSSAGSAVMGGIACNGWKFWTPATAGQWKREQADEDLDAMIADGDIPETDGELYEMIDGATEPAPKAARAATARKTPATRLIIRVPNQHGVEEGKTKFFCRACMNGFLVDAGTTPAACPEGHRENDPELTATAIE